jgi:hypothetical protein
MTEQVIPDANYGSPWFRLLRRAFRVPDLVTDGNAVETIALALVPPPDPNSIPSWDNQVEVARALIVALVARGDEGKLDRYLLVRPHTRSFVGWDDDTQEELKTDLFASLHLRPDPFAGPTILRLISVAIGHAVAHPFYDQDGPPPAETEP